MKLPEIILALGAFMVLSPIFCYLNFKLTKKTSSPFPFIGSIFIIAGNVWLYASGNYMGGYVLSLLLIPFDPGIIESIRALKGKIGTNLSNIRQVEAEVNTEFEEIDALPIAEARERALREIAEHTHYFELTHSAHIDSRIEALDSDTAMLFQQYSELYLIESDTYLKIHQDSLNGKSDSIQIGRCPQDDFNLHVSYQCPMVRAIRREQQIDEFKSIYHYILISIS